MKRFIRLCFLFAFAALFITSCEDIFHQTSQILEEIGNEIKTPEPRRIFIGGDFTYNWDGMERQALAAINGNGNLESFFNSSNHGLIVGSPSGSKWGVTDLSLNDSELYVGGNFQGFDFDGSYIMYDPVNAAQQDFQNIQRYFLDGNIDPNYKPFSGQGNGNEIYAISLLNDTLIAGGNFPAAVYGYFDLVRLDYTGNSAVGFPSIPVANEATSWIYSLVPTFDNSLIMVGGLLTSLGVETGFNNFAGIDTGDLSVRPLGVLPPSFPASSNTEIRDFAWYGESLFVVGNETAMMDARIYKYNLVNGGPSFIEDTGFTTNLATSFMSDPAVYLESIVSIAADQNGSLYIGGNFSWTDQSGFYHSQILKVRQDGSIDESFKVNIMGQVQTIEIQANGKILIGGNFFDVETSSGYHSDFRGILRLTEYGNIDWDFDHFALPGGTIYAIAIEEEPEPAN